MRTASSLPATESPPPVPALRSSFAWTFTGNVVYAASQWAILSLVAKLGDAEMLGRYALAVAVTAPVAMLSHLNLRAVLATDTLQRYALADYLRVRVLASAAGMIVAVCLALARGFPLDVRISILLLAVAQNAENFSDTYYGVLQRRERMDHVGRSMIARGLLSACALAVTLWFTRSLAPAAAALALARLAVLTLHDRPLGSRGERLRPSGSAALRAILQGAIPLGAVLMLVSLTANLPRYAVARFLGAKELGAFAAVASFITVGATAVNALGQSLTPRLARYYAHGATASFLRLAAGATACALAVGLAGALAAVLIGRPVLRILYRPEYAAYSGLLAGVMAASSLSYAAITLGYVITSARSFAVQVPLAGCVAAVAGVAAWLLVPVYGLSGAVMALAMAALVQIAGSLFVLRSLVPEAEAAG